MAKGTRPAPLKISCSMTDCKNDLHCFRKTTKEKDFFEGLCQKCGAELVDWRRIQARDLADAEHTFESLKHEYIRHEFFHRSLDQHALNYALRKGRVGLIGAARKRLVSSIGPAQPYRDGNQTSFDKNPICYAQHATACCCRKCLEYWHGIPRGRPLTDQEIDYCTSLLALYFKQRLPDLSDLPAKVPAIRDPAARKASKQRSEAGAKAPS